MHGDPNADPSTTTSESIEGTAPSSTSVAARPSTGEILKSLGGDVGNDFEFDECGLAEEVIVGGTGAYDLYSDRFSLDVTIGQCQYTYVRAGEDYTTDSQC